MKKQNFGLVVIISVLVLGSCKKQKLSETDQTNNVSPSLNSQNFIKYGVSVDNGLLKFATVANYKALLEMNAEEQALFQKNVQTLDGFTSKRELTQNQTAKIASACGCFIDDDYINSVVDRNYMLVINDFVIKVNACDSSIYVSDNLAPNAAERKDALINCNLTRRDFYKFSFENVVEDELLIIRDSLKGNTNSRGKIGCNEFAISQRNGSDVRRVINEVVYPAFEIRYRNYGLWGKLWIEAYNSTGVINFPAWKFEFSPEAFKRRCSSWTNNPYALYGGVVVGSSLNYKNHVGTRLTSGGLVKARMYRYDATVGAIYRGPYVQIIP